MSVKDGTVDFAPAMTRDEVVACITFWRKQHKALAGNQGDWAGFSRACARRNVRAYTRKLREMKA